MKIFPLTAFCLLLTLPLSAQPVPVIGVPTTLRLAWDHNGLNTKLFNVLADGQIVSTLTNWTAIPADHVWSVPFPALTPGTHELIVQACNITIPDQPYCASSDTLRVIVVVSPDRPANLRTIEEKVSP